MSVRIPFVGPNMYLDQILTKPTEKPRRSGTDRDDPVSGLSLQKDLTWDFQGGSKNTLGELTAHGLRLQVPKAPS